MSVNERLKVTRCKKKADNMKTKWSMINNMRTVNLLDGLLNNEAVSQLNNHYNFSKITNPIAEIRNEIGFENILNYRIDGLMCEEYRLSNNAISIKEVEILKQKILSNIIKKKDK